MRRLYFLAAWTAVLLLAWAFPSPAGATELHYQMADEHRDEIVAGFTEQIAPVDQSQIINNFRNMPELPWDSGTINSRLFPGGVPEDVRQPIVERFFGYYTDYVQTPPSPKGLPEKYSSDLFMGLNVSVPDQGVIRAYLGELPATWEDWPDAELFRMFGDARISEGLRNSPDVQQEIVTRWRQVYRAEQQERRALPVPSSPFAASPVTVRPGYDPGAQPLPARDRGGPLERAIALIIEALTTVVERLASTADFKSLDALIFNAEVPEADKIFLPFTPQEWGMLDKWYNLIMIGFSGLVLLAVIVTAFKFMQSGVNAEMRAGVSQDVLRWIGAVLLVGCAPFLVRALFWLNNAMVDTLAQIAGSVVADRVVQLSGFLHAAEEGQGTYIIEGLTDLQTGSVLGTAVVKLGFLGIMLYLNIIFIVRRFVLMVIYVFTPIAAWLWAMNKNVNAMSVWFGELLSNVFMQTAYAISMLVFLTINADLRISDGSWLTLLITLGAVAPVGEMLRNSLQGLWTRLSGVDESTVAGRGMLGLIGLGSVVSLGRAVTGSGAKGITFGGPGATGASSGGYPPSGGGGPALPGPGGGKSLGQISGTPAVAGMSPAAGLTLGGSGLGMSSAPSAETSGGIQTGMTGKTAAAGGGGLSPAVVGAGAAVGSGVVPAAGGNVSPGTEGGLRPSGAAGEPAGAGGGPVPSAAGRTSSVVSRGARVPAAAYGAAAGNIAARVTAPFAATSLSVVPGGDRLAQSAVQLTAAGTRMGVTTAVNIGRGAGQAMSDIRQIRSVSVEQGIGFGSAFRQTMGVEKAGPAGNALATGKFIGRTVAPDYFISRTEDARQARKSWSADGGLKI